MTEDVAREVAALIAARLMAEREGVVDSAFCDHRIRVGVNSETSVCALCRQKITEDCDFGIRVDGGALGSRFKDCYFTGKTTHAEIAE